MGASKSKLSCSTSTAAKEPSIIMDTMPNSNYSLEFRATLMQCKGGRKVLMRHVESARKSLENTSFWQGWLEYTMRDAVNTEIENNLGTCVKCKNVPTVLNIIIELDTVSKKTRHNPEGHNYITGIIRWRSVLASDKAIDSAVNWWLGNKLFHYGIQDVKEGWICFFHPGELVVN